MPRTLLALIFALLVFAAACGGDDSGTSTPTHTGASESPTATESGGASASPGNDGKTPGTDGSPGATSPGATAPGEVPTPGPTAPGGTPAVAPADESAFLAQFQGQPIDSVNCAYNPSTALTNCGDHGLYSIDPPIVGQDTQCTLLIVNGTPRVVQCHTVDPLQTRNYEIQQ